MKNIIRGVIDADFNAGPSIEGPEYHLRKMIEYCEEKGIRLDELTDEEMKMFEIVD